MRALSAGSARRTRDYPVLRPAGSHLLGEAQHDGGTRTGRAGNRRPRGSPSKGCRSKPTSIKTLTEEETPGNSDCMIPVGFLAKLGRRLL